MGVFKEGATTTVRVFFARGSNRGYIHMDRALNEAMIKGSRQCEEISLQVSDKKLSMLERGDWINLVMTERMDNGKH